MGQSATRGVHGKGELVHHGNDSSDSSSFAEFCSSFCLFFFLGGSDSSPALPPVMGKPENEQKPVTVAPKPKKGTKRGKKKTDGEGSWRV